MRKCAFKINDSEHDPSPLLLVGSYHVRGLRIVDDLVQGIHTVRSSLSLLLHCALVLSCGHPLCVVDCCCEEKCWYVLL